MPIESSSSLAQPKWEAVADLLDAEVHGPSSEQIQVAVKLGLELAPNLPAAVAAVVIRDAVASAILQGLRLADGIPENLTELEADLGLSPTETLLTGTYEEVGAWYRVRYAMKTSAGLRSLRPEAGDVVLTTDLSPTERIISSVGANGRIYFKGLNSGSAWPNHLVMVARRTDSDHAATAKRAAGQHMNAARIAPVDMARFARFDDYALDDTVPAYEAIRELEDLLESGEGAEERYQELITRHPQLLAGLVLGGWKTYVIPKARLGSEHVTDFLILGINSVGPQWVLVELESPRHSITIKDGSPSGPTRHAIGQIQDWRDWLQDNIAYARDTLGLYGLTTRAGGLVVIGQADITTGPQRGRERVAEDSRIEIHSWNWILREARRRVYQPFVRSDFAADDLQAQVEGTRFAGADFRSGQSMIALNGAKADMVLDLDDLF